jgi:hypothetical protein
MEKLQISVDSWIIQDGNYGDFGVGGKVRCALKFFATDLQPSLQSRSSAIHLQGNKYRVCGQVVYSRPGVWIIDFGVKTFENTPIPQFAVGSWVTGEIEIGIDPFDYGTDLCKRDGMPDLLTDWQIHRIDRDDTPWLESTNESGGKMRVRDHQSIRWTEVNVTDAWTEDSTYLLHINLEKPPEAP